MLLENYYSNLYKNEVPLPIKINVHIAYLKRNVLEHVVWKEINKLVSSGLKEASLSIVTHGKLYTSFEFIIHELNEYVESNSVHMSTISNYNEEYSKVVGGLIYRSLNFFFKKNIYTDIIES